MDGTWAWGGLGVECAGGRLIGSIKFGEGSSRFNSQEEVMTSLSIFQGGA